MTRTSSWTRWIAFAGRLMIITGSLDIFQGLIEPERQHCGYAAASGRMTPRTREG
jgi:hypothetical protein